MHIPDAVAGRNRTEEALRFLADASIPLATTLDSNDTIKAIARVSLDAFADWCSIHLLDENGQIVRVGVVHRDPAKEQFAEALQQRGADLSPVWAVIRTRKPFLVPEIDADLPRLNEAGREIVRGLGLRSALMVPLIGRGECIGCISFVREASNPSYDDFDVNVAMEFGLRAGLAIENARLFEQLTAANRTKDEFLGLISHELRTPLTTIVGLSDILARRIDELTPRDRREALDQLQSDSSRLQTLIENLLVLARMESGKDFDHEPFLLQRLIPGIVALHRARHPHREVQVRVPENLPVVSGQSAWLRQVIENLLGNAEKYSPWTKPIHIEAEDKGEFVEVRVLDRGAGIAESARDDVFEAFFRTEDAAHKPGAGLGLAVSKRLVEVHGGRIWCEPRNEGGTVFAFTLPVNQAERARE